MAIENDIFCASKVISSCNAPEMFDLIYPFTTENLSGYFANYDMNDKKVLTVGSSADQILNSFLLGAREIKSFDINPFTKYYFGLKKAAIMALSYDEFLTFFCYLNFPKNFVKNKYAFNHILYNRLKEYLTAEERMFWDTLFNKYGPLKVRQYLFSDDEYNFSVLSNANLYFNEESYNALKKKIHLLNPSFLTSDLRDISSKLDSTYDYIMLSNIACYLERMYECPLLDFREDIISLGRFLNDKGIMFMAYLYDIKEGTKVLPFWDIIYHLDLVFKVFDEDNISLESFIGIKGLIHESDIFKDSVLIYKK